MNYEMTVGLEIHVELLTKSKAFCSCKAQFSKEDNVNVCPVCMGYPGAMPTLNKEAVSFAVKAGLALSCKISKESRFDRKNYFYPDLPKGYQITQFYRPICRDGYLDIESGNGQRRIRIFEIHIEEDAGKTVYTKENNVAVNFNRCSVPLIEIVTAPDFKSADEVIKFLTELRDILRYIEISDGKLEEGSMRADVNLSVKQKDSEILGTRTEMKNLSSFKEIKRAIDSESKRQIDLISRGEKILKQTRKWDEEKAVSIPLRAKETKEEYRYFPEPDLPPVILSDEYIENIKNTIPELPREKRKRYRKDFNLSEEDITFLTSSKKLAILFEKLVGLNKSPGETANFLIGDVSSVLNENRCNYSDISLDENKINDIILMIKEGKINRSVARKTLKEFFLNGIDPTAFVENNDLIMVTDLGIIKARAEEVILENSTAVSEYRLGKDKLFGFFVGQTAKRLNGKADPVIINQVLKQLLNK